jgi:TolA-binding protein
VILENLISSLTSFFDKGKKDLTSDSDVVKMEKLAKAEKAQLITLEKELDELRGKYDELKYQIQDKHLAFAKEKGLYVNRWDFEKSGDIGEQFYKVQPLEYDVKAQIRNQIILSGLKLDNLDSLIGDLVKKFGK